MRWEITDYVFTMRISFFKRKTQQKRCQTFFVFPSGWGGIEKRRHVRSSLTTCLSDCCLCGFDIHHRCFFRPSTGAGVSPLACQRRTGIWRRNIPRPVPITPGMFEFFVFKLLCVRSLTKKIKIKWAYYIYLQLH
jgi:hypothetical protein